MSEIKSLQAKRAELDMEIEVYLKELGLVDYILFDMGIVSLSIRMLSQNEINPNNICL